VVQEQTYTCDRCSQEFPTQQALNEHNNRQHQGGQEGQQQQEQEEF
jgi:hypothetical protein